MGEAELNQSSNQLIIHSVFFFYGDAANADLSRQIAEDIQTHWNEPEINAVIKGNSYHVRFNIQGVYEPELAPETVWYNDNPRFNYFRIEEFSGLHISFTDGLSCNTGYFKLDNLLNNSTTAAHEYGHYARTRSPGQPGYTRAGPTGHYVSPRHGLRS